MKARTTTPPTSVQGFTLVELIIAMTILAAVGVFTHKVAVQSTQGERVGSTLIDAQRTAQTAVTSLVDDLRGAGAGIDPISQLAVEVASQYRVTFVKDRNQDGVIGTGDRVTYFLDTNANDANVAVTANPHDLVLRRVASTASNPQALPASGKGQIIAVGLTQRTVGASGVNVPLFTYVDAGGDTVAGSATDPTSANYGLTLSDSDLGKPKGMIASSVHAVQLNVVTESTYKDPWSGKFNQAGATGVAFIQGTPLLGTGAGLWGIHIDVDTSSKLYPLNAGASDVHCHEWDEKYDTNVVDYFAMKQAALQEINQIITDVNARFKIIVANADLSPQAQIRVNGVTKLATEYDNTKISDLPILTLGGLAGTTKLTDLTMTFDIASVYTKGVHPTKTGAVRPNTAGLKGEWRNGALTIQAIAVDMAGNPLAPTNTALSSGGVQGVATGGLLWESTTFWHWKGPAYNAAGWATYKPTA